jgi:cytochrome P450
MNTQPVPVSQLLVWRRAIQGLFNQHPFNLLSDLGERTEPILVFRVAGEKIYFFNEPDLVKEVLVTNHAKLQKGRALNRLKPTLGNGLLTSEGELHQKQRRIIQPVFNHRNLQVYADPMAARASKLSASWEDSQPINMTAAMMALTLSIVCQTLFGADVESETNRVGELMTKIMEAFPFLLSPFAGVLEMLSFSKLREAAAARAELHGIVQRMIAARRSSCNRRSDLLSLLFAAQDQETGSGMSEQQLEDEVTTIFMAGHETTANALAWTFYLLAQHPGFDQQLRIQLCQVLGDRPPAVAQLPELTLLDQLIHESLRLYPPAWTIGRRAIEDVQIGSAEISKGSLLVVSPWTMHRSERFYAHPAEMRPERWTETFRRQLPKYAYFPFGGGPRQCIGEGFAWMELKVLLAVLLRHWRIELVQGQNIRPKPAITLRSNHPIRVVVHRAA